MPDKPKLLYLVNDTGYFLSHRLQLAQAAQRNGWEVHVATPGGAGVKDIERLGFTFHRIPMQRREGRPWQELATLLQIFRLYRTLRPDLVHHVALKAVLYGGIAAIMAGVPSVVSALMGLGHVFTATGTRVSLLRSLVRGLLRLVFRHGNHRLIVQNGDDRSRLVGWRLVPERSVALIRGSGVDVEEFSQSSEPAHEVTVVLASRMLVSKGVVEFVEAARRLRRRGFPARFLLVGEGDPGNPASIDEAQLEAWHREGAVEWLGHREDMERVLSQCHVVCLPTSYGEGVPKVLIEAAACGRPIVATDAPGCREIVRHGVNGLLVPLHDVAALAQALALLIRDDELRRRLGAAGRELAVREFSLSRVNQETLALYRELFPC